MHPRLSAVELGGKDGKALVITQIERVIVYPKNPDT
jgi:hypothetical protein